MTQNQRETLMHIVFLVCALTSIAAVALICIFMFAGGIPAFAKIGALEFLFGREWSSGNVPPSFGIFPMIIGSIYVTSCAMITGVPVGILTAVFMAKICPKHLYIKIKPAVDLLAGVPSIVYGFFGLVVIVPIVKNYLGGAGASILAASLVLGIMILPTIIGISESSIRAVPESYYEGALALGAAHERAVFFVVVPAAKSGILASIILGIGRVAGETMAVVMVVGNQPRMPVGIMSGARTLTTNIVIEMGYAAGLHREALIATGMVLFIFILTINMIFLIVKKKVL